MDIATTVTKLSVSLLRFFVRRSGWQLDKFDLENATQAELAEQAVKSAI
jgi:hypothetical protein